MAMSSIRVMMTCAVMGQAVGTAAALAASFCLSPHEVYLNKLTTLQNILMDNDCFIPTMKREISNLCKNTAVINGNDTLKNGEDRPHKIYNTADCGVTIKNGTRLEYNFGKLEPVSSVHITFDSDLNRNTLPGGKCEQTHSTRCNTRLDSPQFHVPATLCKEFILEATTENGTEVIFKTINNLNRAYNIPLNKKVSSLRLVPISNWGESDTTAIFSFDFK